MKNKTYELRLKMIEDKVNTTNLSNYEKNQLMFDIEALIGHELITTINNLRKEYLINYGDESRIERLEKLNK